MTRYLRAPLHFDASGRTATTDRDGYVRGLIEQVLLTSQGERLRRPTFGAGLFRAVFAAGGEDLAAAAAGLVQSSLHEWLGDIVDVESVDVSVDDATLRVRVTYTVRGIGERRVDAFELPSGGPT